METSHILKHHVLHHGGQGDPAFHLRPIQYFTTALSRQIAEACRVQKWGEEIVLNSKDEFNRSRIRRLMIGDDKKPDPKISIREEEEDTTGNIAKEKGWEEERIQARRVQELRGAVNLERGVARSPPRKRGGQDPSAGKNKKTKWKYPLLGED